MNKIKLLLMLLLVTVFTAQAQNTPQTLTVNDGSITNEFVPVYGYYVDALERCQFIIPAEDITEMSGKTIDGMTFYLSSPAAASWGNASFQVYIKPYDSETLGTSFIDMTDATMVYSGSLDGTQETMAVVFQTPYDYEEGNLLIEFRNIVVGTYKEASFYGVDKRDASISAYGSSISSITTGEKRNFLPKTTFTYHLETESHTVAAVANPEEGGTVEGVGEFLLNHPCTLVATPNEHYHFVNWKNGDVIVSTNASYTFNVTEDVELTANFAIDQFTVSTYIYPAAGGTVAGAGTFDYGETCTLTATPNTENGYHFVNWYYQGDEYSTETEITFTVEQNMTFEAYFSLNQYAISASANPVNGGTVSGAGTYNYGSTCYLYAIPDSKFQFVNWTKDDEVISTYNNIGVTVEGNAAYVANFEQYVFTISAVSNLPGAGILTGAGNYLEGTEVTLTATPSSFAYFFERWENANGEVVSTEPSFDVTVGTEDLAFTAVFGSHIVGNMEFTVHDGEGTNDYVPFYGYWADAVQRDQMIYPASDLEDAAGKLINKFTFYFDYGQWYDANGSVGDWIVSIGETEATTLNGVDTWTPLTQVYSGGINVLLNHTDKTLTINFATPYAYNGGNLLVEFNHPVASNYQHLIFYGEPVNGASYSYDGQRNFLPKTTFSCYQLEPIVTVAPEELELPGLRPNGAWLEDDDDYIVTMTNIGGSYTINSITMTNSYFTTDLELPYVVDGGETINIHVLRGGSGDGEETGDMVINYGDNEEFTVALTAHAYEPLDGDVWEKAIEVEFDDNEEYANQLPVEGLYANYNLSTVYDVDAVYKVVLPQERLLSVATTAHNASAYIYAEDFDEVGGPSYYNTYYYNGPTFVEQRGNRDNNDFLNEIFDGDEMPEGWTIEAEGMNTWVLDANNHYVKCEHNINAGQYLQYNTYLITPPMDLSNEESVRVTFKYMNKQWDNDVDHFGVYFRNGSYDSWYELMYTIEAHETMTEVVIPLTNINYYMGPEFQLGFKMDDQYGHGVVVDDVTVTGFRLPIDVISGAYLPAGTYYVAVSTDDTDFMEVSMRTDMVPLPVQSYITYPNLYNVTPLDAVVTYELGWFTEEMQILIGITNPPTDVLLDWTAPVASVQLQDLEYNKKYYIQINGRNAAGTTNGDITYFTTVREGVENFAVDMHEAFYGYGTNDTLTFTWDAAEEALGYNLYYGYYYGNENYYWYNNPMNNDVITGTTEYRIAVNDWLNYYLNGFAFHVKAVYKYGESQMSNIEIVQVSSVASYVQGYVYEQDGITPVVGASIALTGTDEFENVHEFTPALTDEYGYFEIYSEPEEPLYIGAYELTVSKNGYVSVDDSFYLYQYGGYDNNYTLMETYYPVANVVAEEVGTDAVISWQYPGGDRSLQGFNVYRTSAYNDGPYNVENTVLVAEGITDMTCADTAWANLEVGSYKYGVAAVYAGNAPTDRGNRDVETIFSESFDNAGLPDGWYVDGLGTSNWSVTNTNNAGGSAKELRLNWSPQFNDMSRMVMPAIDLSNVQDVQFSFKHYLDNYSGGHYIGVATSSDGGTNWNTAWTAYYSSNGSHNITFDVTTPDVGKSDVMFCIFFNDNSYNINQWYFDDIVITAEVAAPILVDNMSEIVWSNPLDVDMEIENGVEITVTLNNGASPEGVEVVFTNVNDPSKVYEVTLDETGHYMWETFYKGTYDATVSFGDDYSTVSGQLVIMNPSSISCTLNYIVPITISASATPEGYGSANVWWMENNSWYHAPERAYLYGEQANVYAQPVAGKEFMFWMNSDTLVSRADDYYFTVKTDGHYEAYFRTPGSHYNVENPLAFENTMSFIGIIQIEGETQNDLELEVGAFVGEECRGGARLDFYEQIQAYRLFMTVYGNEDGEELTFRLYNHADGEELTLRCATTEVFAADAVLGTAAEPYVFNFRNTILQTVELAEGWNWWSTYLEQENFEGLATLEAGLGTNGVSIVSQSNGFVTYDEEYDEWSGNLTALNNEEMFKVNVTADVNFVMENYFADPANHEITLYNGWTYLGFIATQPMSIEEAFAGFEPTDGDMVKAQEGFATYDAEYDEWSGSLNTLTPGAGLMYKSNNDEDVTFTYPAVVRGGTVANVRSEHWTANYHAYPKNMTVTAVVELNDEELAGGDYELAAFANDECRGSVKLINAGAANRYYAFLTVTGNATAELRFALYDASTDMETFDSNASLTFAGDAMVGNMSEPFVIGFRGTTGIGELSNDIAIYPNPASKGGVVRLEVSDNMMAQVEILNTLGQVVSVEKTQMPANIQVPEETGVYTVRVITEGKNIKCQKLIVK